MKFKPIGDKDFESSFADSSAILLDYIILKWIQLCEQITAFEDMIYTNKKYDPLVVQKTVADLNSFIRSVHPYLPAHLRDIRLNPTKEDLPKIIPIFKAVASALYQKGIIRVDNKIKYKTFDLDELFREAVNKDLQNLRNEYKTVIAENEKLKLKLQALEEENRALRAKIQELEEKLKKYEVSGQDAVANLIGASQSELFKDFNVDIDSLGVDNDTAENSKEE